MRGADLLLAWNEHRVLVVPWLPAARMRERSRVERQLRDRDAYAARCNRLIIGVGHRFGSLGCTALDADGRVRPGVWFMWRAHRALAIYQRGGRTTRRHR